MKKIFVYGTLMRGFGNHRLIEDSRRIGKGFTVDKFLMTASFIPYVSTNESEQSNYILGEVYEIDEQTLFAVDRLEGHPSFYRREEVDVRLQDGSIDKCWIYINNGNTGATVVESGNFYLYRRTVDNITRYAEV